VSKRVTAAYHTGFKDGVVHAVTILEWWMEDEGIEFWLTSFKDGETVSLVHVDRRKFTERMAKAIEGMENLSRREKFSEAEPMSDSRHPNYECSDDTCWYHIRPLGSFMTEDMPDDREEYYNRRAEERP